MNIAFKQPMTLTEAKTLIKIIKTEGGKLVHRNATNAALVDNRNRSHVLVFKSNLDLRQLIK